MSAAWIAAYAILWLALFMVGFLVLGTLRRITGVLEQAEEQLRSGAPGLEPGGLEPGARLPSFRVQRLNGGWITDQDLAGADAIFLFLSANCPPCRRLAEELRQHGYGPDPAPYFILPDVQQAEEIGLARNDRVLIDAARDLAIAFRTKTTPHAFLIASGEVVAGSGTPNTSEQLKELIGAYLRGGGEAKPPRREVVPA